MELWIRSQDKKHLLKCETLLIEGVGNNRFGIRAFTKNYDFDIANYETKERALEVLDEIQSLIDNTIHIPLDNIKNVAEQIYTPPFLLYEMPKE